MSIKSGKSSALNLALLYNGVAIGEKVMAKKPASKKAPIIKFYVDFECLIKVNADGKDAFFRDLTLPLFNASHSRVRHAARFS